jgi:hypothetical protein
MTPYASNTPSGLRQMASVLRAKFTRTDSQNSSSNFPRSRQLDLQMLLTPNRQRDQHRRNHKALALLSNS